MTSANRCRNCGLKHMTQTCPSYGPWFPAPGKTSQDYGDEAQRIANLVAADIIAEHEGRDDDDEIVRVSGKNNPHISDEERRYRTVECLKCNAKVGEACLSVNGREVRTHVYRRKQVEAKWVASMATG